MGKVEGAGENWHGHVTALSVAPEYRRLNLAARLMDALEQVSEKHNAYFVDLFVRVSNKVAVDMYKRLGYSVFRRVLEYYSGDPDEDAFGMSALLQSKDLSLITYPYSRLLFSDMRKALSRDKLKKSIIPCPYPVRPEDLE